MEIFKGNPVAEGRYLVFAGAESAKEWCCPIVLLWYGGHWCYGKDLPFPRHVHGHSGLLPVGKLSDIFPEDFQDVPEVSNGLGLEYDL